MVEWPGAGGGGDHASAAAPPQPCGDLAAAFGCPVSGQRSSICPVSVMGLNPQRLLQPTAAPLAHSKSRVDLFSVQLLRWPLCHKIPPNSSPEVAFLS